VARDNLHPQPRDGHQSLIWSRCAYETVVRFLRDPASVELTTICAN
jgi:hypothetical protein